MNSVEFVRRSIELHGNKYDYTESVYVDQQTKVKIFCRTCQKHFEQKPQKHYAKGEGCWECGVAKRTAAQTFTFEQFVEKARIKHGKRFDYDRTTYTRAKDKLTIRCRTCKDIFEQQGNSHLLGTGCPRCSVKIAHIKQSYGGEGFIVRARQIHGDKFDYLGCSDPHWRQKSIVTWRCRDCSLMHDQLVLNHLAGQGCARCSGKEHHHTLESFVEKSKRIHGNDRYDYSNVEYVDSKTHVWVTCIPCQLTWQVRPYNHMNGKECPRCVAKRFVSKGETVWLDSLNIDLKDRNVWVKANGRKFNVDALVGTTVYEFNGDYYHGNPAKFAPEKVNHKCGLTMKELYDKTLEKHACLEAAGYTVVSMWESEWTKLMKARTRAHR